MMDAKNVQITPAITEAPMFLISVRIARCIGWPLFSPRSDVPFYIWLSRAAEHSHLSGSHICLAGLVKSTWHRWTPHQSLKCKGGGAGALMVLADTHRNWIAIPQNPDVKNGYSPKTPY